MTKVQTSKHNNIGCSQIPKKKKKEEKRKANSEKIHCPTILILRIKC
jgi:hypothetical protein